MLVTGNRSISIFVTDKYHSWQMSLLPNVNLDKCNSRQMSFMVNLSHLQDSENFTHFGISMNELIKSGLKDNNIPSSEH